MKLPDSVDQDCRKKVKKLKDACIHDVNVLSQACQGLGQAGLALAREHRDLLKVVDILTQRVERLEKNAP